MDKIVFMLSIMATAIVGLLTISRLIRARTQRAILTRMIDRFSSARDLSDFLQSRSGSDWMSSLTDRIYEPVSAIAQSVRLGIILCFVGCGCFLPPVRQLDETFPASALGTLLVFAGLGFLASAAASFLLSRKFNLLPGPRDQDR
jgi:hypothetical protein